MDKVLTFSYVAGQTEITVSRSDTVPEHVWLRLLAECGGSGRRPSEAVQIPVGVFLGRLEWLKNVCRRAGVAVKWEGDAQSVVVKRLSDKKSLQSALVSSSTTSNPDLHASLSASGFDRELKDFQLRDLSKLSGLEHGANFSVPGAGKTAVALATHKLERAKGRVEQLLVVAPISAFESWEQESLIGLSPRPKVHRFTGYVPSGVDIVLTNYQRLESGFDTLANWMTSKPTHMILDEAHRMKRGWSGEWGRNSLNLAVLAARRDILTGTPAPQATTDLEALFDFLWPGEGRFLIASNPAQVEDVSVIANRIEPLFVRTTKSDLQLPEPTIRIVRRPLKPLHNDIYQAIRGVFKASFSSSQARLDFRALARVVMYMLEAATNPALLVAGSSRHDPIEFRHPPLEIPLHSNLDELLRSYHDFETPWKIDYLRSVVAENSVLGRKTLVWSNFVRNLVTLAKHELVEFSPAVIHGGIDNRDEQLARFRSDDGCQVLLANPAAMSEGVSLHQACHDAVYLERTFNAGHYLQSVDRIHRLGLNPNEETRVTILSSMETIDAVVDDRIKEKADRLAELMGDPGLSVMSLPAEIEEGLDGDSGVGLDSMEDARDLLRHLMDE